MEEKTNYNQKFNNNRNHNQSRREDTKISKSTDFEKTETSSAQELQKGSKEVMPQTKPKTFKVTNCLQLNLREKPNLDANIIKRLVSGAELKIEDITNDWAHVYTTSGIEGYVMAAFIEEVL